MKIIYITLVISILLIQLNAKTLDEKLHIHQREERFLAQLGDWFNQNVVQPVTGAATWTLDSLLSNPLLNDYIFKPITTATNSLTNWLSSEQTQSMLNDYISWLNQNIVNPVTGAANWTVEQFTNGFYWTVNAITGVNTPLPQEINPCEYTCFNRVAHNNKTVDYEFDKQYGCVSKGLINYDLNRFDDCCDEHNKCLNSQCCTTNCNELKQACDFEFATCLKQQCSNYDADEEMLQCNSLANVLKKINADKKCRNNLTKSRKICLC